jgi:hypothetical protein
MAEIGSLQVRIGADTTGLTQGIQQSESSINRLGGIAARGALAVAKIGTAAAAAGVALGVALTKEGLSAADALAKLSRSMDATADGLQAMQIAADRSGVSAGALATSAQTLNRELAKAAREGSGPAAEALERLGLNARELSDMDVDQRMATLSDRMFELGMSAGQAQDVMRDLGIRSREMALLMVGGGDAIRQARQDVDDFGLSLSDVDAANIERANDAMADVKRIVDAVQQRLAAAFAPVLEMISNKFIDASREAGGFRDAIDSGIRLGIKAFAFLADAIEGVNRIFQVAGNAIAVGFAQLVSDVFTFTDAIVNGPIRVVNLLIAALNAVTGTTFEPIGLSDFGRRIEEASQYHLQVVAEGQKQIAAILAAPLPSEGILKSYDDAVIAANAASQAQIDAAAARDEMLRQMEEERGVQVDEKELARKEKEKAAMEARLESLNQHLMTELELERHQQAARIAELMAFHNAGLTSEEEYFAQLQKLQEKHEAAIGKIQAKGGKDQIKEGQQTMQSIFESTKVGAIATALIKAREAITSAYAFGNKIGGPPVGAAFAGVAGAFQASQIAGMRSSTLSGGGGGAAVSGGGGGGGGVAMQAQAPQQSSPTQMLQVSGISTSDMFSGQVVRDLANKLLDFQRDGGRVVFAD